MRAENQRRRQFEAERSEQIKLPELLIEVDNELRFTHHFMPTASREERRVDEVCAIIATIMAHGSNVGPETMSKLIQAATYREIQRITDWQLAEENQRSASSVFVFVAKAELRRKHIKLSMPLRLWTPHGDGEKEKPLSRRRALLFAVLAMDNVLRSTGECFIKLTAPSLAILPLNSTPLLLTTMPHFMLPQLNAHNEMLLMFWMDCSTMKVTYS
jgi:hypothetical protein